MQQDQGLELLKDPVALELLASSVPARLAYCWTDGTPRVVPIAFHWNGEAFVMGTPPTAPKVGALAANGNVALTIDDDTFPYKVLLVRGVVELEHCDGLTPEYELAVHRCMGQEVGAAWVEQLRGIPMVKITMTPTSVHILDFVSRFPSAISA